MPPSEPSPRGRLRRALAAYGAAAAGLALAFAVAGGRAWQWRERFVDDAFIGFRYAARWAAGDGLTFNPGERVEGITNLGWTLLLGAAGDETAIPALAKLLGLALACAALLLLTLAAGRLAGGVDERCAPASRVARVAWLPMLLVASPDFLYFSLAGMETGLAAALVAAILAAAAWRRSGWLLGLLAGALWTVRPEAALVAPLACAGTWFAPAASQEAGRTEEPRRAAARALAIAAAAVAAATLARRLVFGAWLPNTFQSKPSGLGDLAGQALGVLDGSHLNLPPPFAGLALPVLGVWGVAALAGRSRGVAVWCGALLATGAGFAVYAPPDWTGTGRYFGPYLPAAWLALWWGATAALDRLRAGTTWSWMARRIGWIAGAAAALLCAHGVARTERLLGPEAAGVRPGYVLTGEDLVAPAKWLGRALPADAAVATRRIGAVGFYSGLRVFDYSWGLTDREVAALVARHGGAYDDPRHPDLAQAWRRARPDYLLEDEDVVARWFPRGLPAQGEPAACGAPETLTIHGIDYTLRRRFPLGDGTVSWLLYEARRVDRIALLAPDPSPAPGGRGAPPPDSGHALRDSLRRSSR